MLELVLALVLQLPPDHKVALVFDGRTEIVEVAKAEQQLRRLERKRHRTQDDDKRRAALVIALGTRPENEYHACADLDPLRHQPLCETIRGRRLPLQRKESR